MTIHYHYVQNNKANTNNSNIAVIVIVVRNSNTFTKVIVLLQNKIFLSVTQETSSYHKGPYSVDSIKVYHHPSKPNG